MKPRILFLIALFVVSLATAAPAADAKPDSQDQAYRDYLDTYNKRDAEFRRDYRIKTVVALVIVAGLIAFGLVPVQRMASRTLEVSKQQLKLLEEIRDLLKRD